MIRQAVADTLRRVAWWIAPTEAYRRVRRVRQDALPSPEFFAAIEAARDRKHSAFDATVTRGVDAPTVCVTHRRFVPCRSRCRYSTDPADVAAVRAYQQGGDQ